ncbi:HAD superfamily hydrolase (TIGR01509 family) [Elusimicrobium simillimum]|uniref:HAD family hydrolase n=1 Tax=Elusimicrobium simillimum TaxID=3143438 RepID=UPI003C6F1D3E
MTNKNIKLAIFDMDGLLLDSERLYEDFFFKTTKQFGYEGTKEIYSLCIGIGNHNIRRILRERFGQDFPAEEIEQTSYKNIWKHVQTHGIDQKTGVKEVLARLKQLNIPAAVASSNDKNFVHFALERSGLAGEFKVINTAGDVERTKPAPDLFLKTAKDFNIAPKDCIVFEDSENGVLAAEAAGIPVVLIPDIKDPAKEIKAKAYKVYNTLHDALELFK